MKNLALPLLLLAIAAGQAIRIESVHADEPANTTAVETRADAVAKWHTEAYRVEPPDVLSIKLVKGLHQSSNKQHKADEFEFDGKHLLGPDGRVNLGNYGSVFLAA